jgi:phosphonatase-like hydrolase
VLLYGAGKEKLKAMRDTLAQIVDYKVPEAEILEIFEDFKQRLNTAYRKGHFTEQPGATALFEQLKADGVHIALNTGYERHIADLLLAKLGWDDHHLVPYTVTADEVDQGRPAPDMILKAMSHFGVTDPGKVLKIGDSIIDIEEGKNAECGVTLGITTGAHTREQLNSARPTAVIDRLSAVYDWIG